MEARGKLIVAVGLIVVMALLALSLVVKPTEAHVKAPIPTPSQAGCACAAAPVPVPVKKYLIFWKEKDGYKASPILFPSLETASAAIPRDAEEARIVPVRID